MIAGIIAVCTAWFGIAAFLFGVLLLMPVVQFFTSAGKAKRKAEREWSRK